MGDEPTRRGNAGQTPGRGGILSQPWLVASVLLLAAAGALLWAQRPDAAFVAAALGVSAWFYNVGAGLKRKHDLVRLGGRNWVPRGEVEEDDVDDADDDEEDDDAEDDDAEADSEAGSDDD